MHSRDIANLYDTYMEGVFRFVFSRVRNRELAEDIVSDTFIKVLKNRDDFEERSGISIKSWIYTIAHHTLIDAARKRNRNPQVDIDTLELGKPAEQSDEYDMSHDLTQVLAALEKLPDSQQECLLLRLQSDLKNKEIAELLQISERTVSGYIARGIATLKKELTPQI